MNHFDQKCKCGHRKGCHTISSKPYQVGHCCVRVCEKHNLVQCSECGTLKTIPCHCETFGNNKTLEHTLTREYALNGVGGYDLFTKLRELGFDPQLPITAERRPDGSTVYLQEQSK